MMRRTLGFTLIELLVVMAILAILLGLALPSVIAIEDGEKATAAVRRIEAHATAIRAFAEDMKRLPQSLAELVTNTTGNAFWKGPYLDVPTGASGASVDPWDTTLQMAVLDQKTVRLRSAGPNLVFAAGGGGSSGNDDDDVVADVSISQALRVATKFTVDRVNAAIVAYNGLYLASQPLNGNIDSVVATLNNRSLLPNGFDWTTDGFGVKLLTSAPPITYVYSTTGS